MKTLNSSASQSSSLLLLLLLLDEELFWAGVATFMIWGVPRSKGENPDTSLTLKEEFMLAYCMVRSELKLGVLAGGQRLRELLIIG